MRNEDLDLITHEVLCHHPCYKSFILSYISRFWKASPMINFEETLNHPLSTVPLRWFNAIQEQEQTGSYTYVQVKWRENRCFKKNTTYVVDLMELMRVVIVIPETFKDLALKLISILPNWKIFSSWLGCRLLLRKFHQSCREGKEWFCNKDDYKNHQNQKFLEISQTFGWMEKTKRTWLSCSFNH